MLDQFYTRPAVARKCVERVLEIIEQQDRTVFIEPAAGSGSFLDVLPEPRLGLDIAPARADIECANFLQWTPRVNAARFVVVSNFPFGKNASLALKFMNHAAGFADVVASILPRTFEKESMQRRISARLELVDQMSLPADSFLYLGEPYSVPVVFQIWRKCALPRQMPSRPMTHPDFAFMRVSNNADFAFQRVGVRAGRVSVEGLRKAKESYYFISILNQTRDVMGILSSINWSEIKCKTAGNPSIGKAELVNAYIKRIVDEQPKSRDRTCHKTG